jgi:hypothetical protein
MTRDEYRQAVKEVFVTDGWEHYYQHINFPELLRSVAVECFISGDLVSPLAQETQRRMTQLKTIGETD